jgi:hypothetical protein
MNKTNTNKTNKTKTKFSNLQKKTIDSTNELIAYLKKRKLFLGKKSKILIF